MKEDGRPVVLFNAQGARVLVADLPTSAGADVAKEIGENATFVAIDVSSVVLEMGPMCATTLCISLVVPNPLPRKAKGSGSTRLVIHLNSFVCNSINIAVGKSMVCVGQAVHLQWEVYGGGRGHMVL